MTTLQQEADELLREWQERRRRGADELLREWQEWCRRGIAKREKINDGEATIQRIEAGFALFAFLVSSRKEIRARKVTRAAKPLPRYAERDRNGRIWFRVDGGKRTPLPKDTTLPEFSAAYNAALVDAIAREDDDGYDCIELEAMHRAQRRGTAKHGARR